MSRVARLTGNNKRLIRKFPEAESLLSESIHLQKELDSLEADEIRYLSETHRDIAILFKSMGKLVEAEGDLDAGLKLLKKLPAAIQDASETRRVVATLELERVGLCEDLDRGTEALKAARSSWDASFRLINSDDKMDNDYLVGLLAASRLGQQLHRQGKKRKPLRSMI